MLLRKITGYKPKETETTLRDSIWTANDNREKKIHSGRFMLFVKHQNFTQDVTK